MGDCFVTKGTFKNKGLKGYYSPNKKGAQSLTPLSLSVIANVQLIKSNSSK
jgi:hypothetical protein